MRRYRSLVPDDGSAGPSGPGPPPGAHHLTARRNALTGRSISHIPYETTVIAPGLRTHHAYRRGPGTGRRMSLASTAREVPHRVLVLSRTLSPPRLLKPASSRTWTQLAPKSFAPRQQPALPPPRASRRLKVIAQAATWLAGDHLYGAGAPPATRRRSGAPSATAGMCTIASGYIRQGGLEVRNLLVSNAEYVQVLERDDPHAGMPNNHSGTYLLACEMPHQRGGRLH